VFADIWMLCRTINSSSTRGVLQVPAKANLVMREMSAMCCWGSSSTEALTLCRLALALSAQAEFHLLLCVTAHFSLLARPGQQVHGMPENSTAAKRASMPDTYALPLLAGNSFVVAQYGDSRLYQLCREGSSTDGIVNVFSKSADNPLDLLRSRPLSLKSHSQ